ncbi:V-set and immunoglobulin domain-containing protein 10, partial [Ophiophagus hannah]
MEVSISPTGTLPNGTLFAKRHDVLNFTCSSDSWPDSATKWDFNPLGSAQEPFTEVNSSRSSFVLQNVMPNYQGNYSCLATNLLSQHQKSVIHELLVYYPPLSSPKCWAETSMENSQEVQLSCTWPGGYPSPTLQWIHPEDLVMDSNTTHFANATVVSLQGSHQLWGKDFICRGSHIVNEKENQNCTLRLERPSVMSSPMKSCFVGGPVEMSCELTAGNPPARITWLRNLSKVEIEIRSGGRFLVSQKDGVSTLVIQNCSTSRDQGNRDAGDILELMDSEEEDLYLESTGELTLHQMEGIGNGCSTRSTESKLNEARIRMQGLFWNRKKQHSRDNFPCGPAEELEELGEISQLVLDPRFPAQILFGYDS